MWGYNLFSIEVLFFNEKMFDNILRNGGDCKLYINIAMVMTALYRAYCWHYFCPL